MDHCGARGRSGVVHHLVGQCNRGAIGEGSWPVPPLQEKGQKLPFAFHKDGTSPHKAEAVLSKDDLRLFYHLDVAHDSCGFHPAGHIDRIAPDVIVWFPGSNDASQNPSFVHAYAQHEVVE